MQCRTMAKKKTHFILFSAGTLADISGDYSITFYMAGASLALAGIICFPLRRISRWEKSRDQTINKDRRGIVIENGKHNPESKVLLDQS